MIKFMQILRKLRKIREKRSLHRNRRSELGFLSISLAGYTSAGKSSLFYSLTDETTEVDQALFTTLSTTTRLLEITKRKFLLTDTVGFIDRLPLSLIEAFHSTLEETIYSDLIILVLDFSESSDLIKKKNKVCLDTIEKIGASNMPIITVLNKIDKISEQETQKKIVILKTEIKNPLLISALHKKNLELLKQEILKKLENYTKASFSVPATEQIMPFISWLHQKADVEKTEYKGDSVQIILKATPQFMNRVKKRVQELNDKIKTKKPQTKA